MKWVLLCHCCLEARVFPQADEVGHDAERAGNTLGHLPVEGECHIDVGPLAVVSVEQAALLRVLIDVVHFGERCVSWIPRVHEAVASLFDPAIEVVGCDLVRPGHERIAGLEERHL